MDKFVGLNLKRFAGWVGSALVCSVVVAGCGGGEKDSGTDKSTAAESGGSTGSVDAPVKAITAAANFTVVGQVRAERPYAGAVITAFDATGKLCSTTQADDKGAYSLAGKCVFPIVLTADLPDGNDVLPLDAGVKGEGRQWVAAVPETFKDGEQFSADITPISTAATVLALGKMPQAGTANSRTLLTSIRLQAALERIGVALKPFMDVAAVGMARLSAGEDTSATRLMELVRVTTLRIPSTKQTLVKFQSATEHRPVVLSLLDGRQVSEAFVDTGLGMDVASVDQAEFRRAFELLPELTEAMSHLLLNPLDLIDPRCFLHNGSGDFDALFDLPRGWTLGGHVIENPKILRINTFTNLVNETLEERNPGNGKLAYISFDFRDMRGMKRRGYTWLLKGDQQVGGGCESVGSTWRVLGNQRPTYVRTETYALHKITYDSKFAGRLDSKGVGISSYLDAKGAGAGFSHVLVSGPGIPGEGKVFIRSRGDYLLSTISMIALRVQGLIIEDPASTSAAIAKALVAIDKTVLDTESIVMADAAIKDEITDAFFDEQNTYQYRFFKSYASLAPALTLNDVLPKRPYTSAELPYDYFASVGVNLDNLVRGLKQPESVVINWSLPPDIRGKVMTPYWVAFQRMSCLESTTWPKCVDRSSMLAEYVMARQFPLDALGQSTTLLPDPPPTYKKTVGDQEIDAPTFMREGRVRVVVLDSLNRPIEISVGMDYSR